MEENQSEPAGTTSTNSGNSMKFFLFGFLFAIFIFAIGAGAYFFGQKQSGKTNTDKQDSAIQITPDINTATTPTPTPSPIENLTKDQVKENIVASLNSKNFAALESYMTEEVSVILQATECCGPMSKNEAVEQIDSYLKNAKTPWNFDDANPLVISIKASYPQTYKDIVGIAANEYVIGVNLDENNKIKGVSLSVSYKLLVP